MGSSRIAFALCSFINSDFFIRLIIMKLLAYIILIVLLIVFSPFAIIWALNTLFTAAIPYTFWTWLAVIVLNSLYLNPHIKNK